MVLRGAWVELYQNQGRHGAIIDAHHVLYFRNPAPFRNTGGSELSDVEN